MSLPRDNTGCASLCIVKSTGCFLSFQLPPEVSMRTRARGRVRKHTCAQAHVCTTPPLTSSKLNSDTQITRRVSRAAVPSQSEMGGSVLDLLVLTHITQSHLPTAYSVVTGAATCARSAQSRTSTVLNLRRCADKRRITLEKASGCQKKTWNPRKNVEHLKL